MKTALKFTVLFLTMLIINSCGKDEIKNTDEIPITEESTKSEEQEGGGMIIGGIYPFYQHLLFINFQDVSGNDLVEGSEFIWNSEYGMRDVVKPEFYTLDIIFEAGIPNPWKPEPNPNIIYDERYPRIYLTKKIMPFESLEKSLWFETQSVKIAGVPEALLYGTETKKAAFAEKIIFRLTCRYLFGDNEAHDIITWWELKEGGYPVCYRLEFEDNEFQVDEQVTTIILDR